MSTSSETQTTTELNAQTVEQIAGLARLSLSESQSTEYAESLNKILGMMARLKAFDTDDIEPLKSPFDHPQPLREDTVSETNHREEYQAIAPSAQDGFYLVPRVVE